MITTVLLFAALAHDFWIEPTAFRPQPGQLVGLRLRVGQDLLGDPVPRDPALLDRFLLHDAAGAHPVAGRDGNDPAGIVRIDSGGLLVAGYQSYPSPVEMAAGKFAQYLQEEGLDRIPAPVRPVREIFSRCAKALILSGAPDQMQSDRRLGFTLELLAEENPYAADELPVRLLYQGRPIAGVLVVAFHRRDAAGKQSARTDAQGCVRFRVAQPGLWLVKAVHMVPAPASAKADWASYWASLTFERK